MKVPIEQAQPALRAIFDDREITIIWSALLEYRPMKSDVQLGQVVDDEELAAADSLAEAFE